MNRGLGTKIKIGSNSIAEITEINGMDMSADTWDATTLDDTDGYRKYKSGLKDGGDVSISAFFNPADTNGQKAVYDLFDSGAESAFAILFPAALGAEWDFNGIVTAIKTGANTEDGVPFEAKIKVSGKPSLGLTASGGLTALSLTGIGGSLTPTFANDKYYYSFSGVTATSVTVTATAASYTLALYIDGVFSQWLTSGSASASIAMAAVGSKKLTIVASEAGKTQKIYEVVVVKTA